MNTSALGTHHPADRALRVAIVTETYAPEINGVAMTLERLTQGLLARGHSVELVRPRQQNEANGTDSRSDASFNEILVQGIPIPGYAGLKFGLPASNRLQQRWQQQRPDIVHVVTEGPLGMSAVKTAQRLKLPLTSSFHTNFHRYSKHYGFGWLRGLIASHLRRMHNRTAATFVPTHALAAELGADGFANLRVMARGVDTALFNPLRRSRALRGEWGLGEHDLAVLYVGRLAAEKNLGLVLEAFKAIAEQHPTARLIFVGDGPLAGKLRQQCPHAIFCGSQRGEMLASHYASGDIFLFPSLTETFGNVTTEALASGLGVVAYAHAAAAELIHHQHNGITVAAGDGEGYVHAAVALANDHALLQAIRQQASISMQDLDWQHIIDTFAATLRSVVNHPVGGHHGSHDIVLASD